MNMLKNLEKYILTIQITKYINYNILNILNIIYLINAK